MKEQTIEIVELARSIVDVIADKKGEDILLLDLRERTIIADYFILCSGSSERQLKAIVDGIDEEIKKQYQISPRAVEGEAETGWVLIDYGDVIVHAFDPEVRDYYDLEGFWLEQKALIVVKMQ